MYQAISLFCIFRMSRIFGMAHVFNGKMKKCCSSAPGGIPELKIVLSDTARQAAANGMHEGPKFEPKKIKSLMKSMEEQVKQ